MDALTVYTQTSGGGARVGGSEQASRKGAAPAGGPPKGLRAAKAGGHDPMWVAYPVPPPVGQHKKAWHEDLLHRIVCRRCRNITRKAEDLAQRDCVVGSMPSTTHKLLKRFRLRLEDTDVPIIVKEATQNTVAILEQSFKRDGEVGSHSIEAVAWPGEEWSVKFLCSGCSLISETEGTIRGGCDRPGATSPSRVVTELRGIAGEEGGRGSLRPSTSLSAWVTRSRPRAPILLSLERLQRSACRNQRSGPPDVPAFRAHSREKLSWLRRQWFQRQAGAGCSAGLLSLCSSSSGVTILTSVFGAGIQLFSAFWRCWAWASSWVAVWFDDAVAKLAVRAGLLVRPWVWEGPSVSAFATFAILSGGRLGRKHPPSRAKRNKI